MHSPAVALTDASTALWTWQRALDPEVASGAECLVAGPEFNLRTQIDPSGPGAAEALVTAAANAGVEPRSWSTLVGDIVELATMLADVTDSAEVEVRVEHELSARCPVFHHDNNTLRLMRIYTGPGTEWLSEHDLDRDQLGLRGRTPAAANAAIAMAGRVQRARPGQVLIGKGARFADGHRSLVHKSPAPEHGRRLFVAIDPGARYVGCTSGC